VFSLYIYVYIYIYIYIYPKTDLTFILKDMRNGNKAQRVNGIFTRSKRRLGKLPPVYPNGWFVLLESSQLKRGQVKHVSALGENFAVFRYEWYGGFLINRTAR